MISGWIAFTVSAALFQCWRTAMQQRLRGELSVNAAGVVRYLYGVPVGLALVAVALSIGADGPVQQLATALAEHYSRFTWSISLP